MADKMADNRLTALTAKNHQEYICECCNYKTLRLSEFNRHKNTAKHRRSEKITKITENEENKKRICECGKSYKQRQSLHKHKKKCLFQEKMEETLENQEIKKKTVYHFMIILALYQL